MPSEFKYKDGFSRSILRKYLKNYLPYNHCYRPRKSNLTNGLISNFSNEDIDIVQKQISNLNSELEQLIDIKTINKIIDKWKKTKEITETDIINFQIFVNTNIF